jgi:hypothetical protein
MSTLSRREALHSRALVSYTSNPNPTAISSQANTRYGLYKQPSETCGITGCKPKSGVFMAATMESTVFWDVTLYILVRNVPTFR